MAHPQHFGQILGSVIDPSNRVFPNDIADCKEAPIAEVWNISNRSWTLNIKRNSKMRKLLNGPLLRNLFLMLICPFNVVGLGYYGQIFNLLELGFVSLIY